MNDVTCIWSTPPPYVVAPPDPGDDGFRYESYADPPLVLPLIPPPSPPCPAPPLFEAYPEKKKFSFLSRHVK